MALSLIATKTRRQRRRGPRTVSESSTSPHYRLRMFGARWTGLPLYGCASESV